MYTSYPKYMYLLLVIVNGKYIQKVFRNLIFIPTRVNHSTKCKVWRANRDRDIKNHNLGKLIAQLCKGRKIADAILTWQGHEVKVCQFCVKSEVQTLRTESSVDFKSDSGSLGLHLQHIFKNQPWLLRESGETVWNLHAQHLILPFIPLFIQRLHKLY